MKINLNKRQLSISEIVTMQNELNTKADINNPNWRNIRKREDFILAASLEFAELIESIPWKWWKKKNEIDYWNIKIEAIDILHFLASILLIDGLQEEEENKIIGADSNFNTKLFTNETTINRVYALKLLQNITLGEKIVTLLNELMSSIDLSSDEVSAIYIAKYALNEIRWSNGYSDGSYKKQRGGMEDNVFLKEIVENFLNNKQLILKDIHQKVFQNFL